MLLCANEVNGVSFWLCMCQASAKAAAAGGEDESDPYGGITLDQFMARFHTTPASQAATSGVAPPVTVTVTVADQS